MKEWEGGGKRKGSRAIFGMYERSKRDGQTLIMHSEIMKTTKNMLVDHINGDTLDNRRENLRICTRIQNSLNRGSNRGSKSRYLGVSWHSVVKLWIVRITVNSKKKHIGTFKTELEAGIIANIMMRKYYGEFARPNKLIKIRYDK